MHRRVFIITLIVLFCLSSLAVGIKLVSAQVPQPSASQAPQVNLGQPGLSYRYVKSLGTLGTPYFADTTHLNRPLGLFIDGSNNLYMTEDPGSRVLKFSPSKVNLFALGFAGVCDGGNTGFCSPKDIAKDKNGNFWVVDAQRAAQYSPSGTFLQEFPANHPWESGSDNDHFNQPTGIAFDTAGRMYVSENQNHRVNVFDMTAGSPVYSSTIGHTGVTGTDPGYFNNPMRIAIDSLDRVYVADFGNNRVQRCVYSSGWSCTVLDSGYNGAQGIAIDKNDNVFITDTWNYRIRKCTSSGSCTTWVNGTRGNYDLAVDASGNIYGSAPWEDLIDKYDSTGTYQGIYLGVQFVPYLTDGYHYFHPRLTIDHANNIIIIEEHGHRLIKLDPNGTLLWTFGVPGVDADDDNHLSYPAGVAVDKNNNIYVSDNCRVKIFSPTGTYLGPLGTGCGTGNYQFSWVPGIAVDNNGNIYVSDFNNHRVMIYNSSKTYVGQIGVTGVCSAANDHLCNPNGLDVDAAGNIYVADSGNSRVQKFNTNRQWVMTIGNGTWGNQFDQFNWIGNVSVDAQGKILISDWNNNRVQVFDAVGNYLTTIGGEWGTNSSQLKGTPGVDIDSKGNVYVADWENARIQVFAPGIPGWRQVNINGFGNPNNGVTAPETFNGDLYASSANWGFGAQVWRLDGANTWTPASELGFSSIYSKTNSMVGDMLVFNGNLYAGTVWGGSGGGQIWRSANGSTWNKVLDDTIIGATNGIRVFTAANNAIIAGSWSYTNTHGAEIYSSPSGNPGSWTKIATNGFGDANNVGIYSLGIFNGFIYAGTFNTTTGGEVWQNDGNGWIQANSDGFNEGVDNGGVTSLVTFKNQLYASTTNCNTGGQVWRTSNGTSWTKVVTGGFGDINNCVIEYLTVFQDQLYGVTNNHPWNSDFTGAEVWRSVDGVHWEQVNLDGFGDSNNKQSFGMMVSNNSLYVSTLNSANGGEIWQLLKPVYLPLSLK